MRGEACPIEKISGAAGGDESGGSVGENDIAARAVFVMAGRAAENFVDDFGVGFRVATCQGFERRARKAEIFGRERVIADGAIAQLGNRGFSRKRNFIEAVGAVNDESAADAEFAESAGEEFHVTFIEDADDLRGRAGGIRERTEKIEDGADAEFAAGIHGVARRGVKRGREKKGDADFVERARDGFGRKIDAKAERFENVGRAAVGADGAIAVFRDANARAGDDESGGCRDVESAAGIAAGAAGVDEDFIGGAAAGAGGEERSGVTAHDGGEADEFVDGFAFEAQRGEEACNLSVGGLAGENLLHGGFGFGAGEIVAGDDFFEGVVKGGGGSLRGVCGLMLRGAHAEALGFRRERRRSSPE